MSGMMKSNVSLNTEIRKLDPIEKYKLGQILNISDSWKQLLAVIPNENQHPRFNSEHIKIIEQAVLQQRRNAAEILLDEWGTMGKIRPTLGILLDLVVKIQLFRVADYIAVDILKGEPPVRPTVGPAAPVDISDQAIDDLIQEVIPKMQTNSLVFDFSEAPNVFKTVENQINPLRLNYTNDSSKNDTYPTVPICSKSDLKKFSLNDLESSITEEIPKEDELSRYTNSCSRSYHIEQNIMGSNEIPLCVHHYANTNALGSSLSSNELPTPLHDLPICSDDDNCNITQLHSSTIEITNDTDRIKKNCNELNPVEAQCGFNKLVDEVNYNNDQVDTQELPVTLLEFNPCSS